MSRFGIRDVLWSMVLTGIAIAWWLDHRGAEVSCNARCNPIICYAQDLVSAVHAAKLRTEYREDILVALMVERGRSEANIRKDLQDDGVDWSILDRPRPYSFH